MFAVIDVAEPERHIHLFDEGRKAGDAARALNEDARAKGTNNRYRVVPVAANAAGDTAWHVREASRYESGEYKPLPWHGQEWAVREHFAHVSKDDPTKIAFTADASHGEQDRQTRMRPGRYLERFYSDKLTQDERCEWCGKYSVENEALCLLFASEPDDIEWVYTHGPSSCMSRGAEHYNGDEHPTRIYGAGDLAIAYIKDAENSDRVTARALCWPAKLIYGRVYGDESRLEELLETVGYTRGDSSREWDGARLLRIECNNGFIAPYLDNPNYGVDDTGKNLVISRDGEYECQETNGTCAYGECCDRCGERCTDTYSIDDESWCIDCRDDHANYCKSCCDYTSVDGITDHRGNFYCEGCYSAFTCCARCGEYHDNDDISRDVNDDPICEDCASRMARTHCGLPADDKDDCDCGACDAERERLSPEGFVLEVHNADSAVQERDYLSPVVLKKTTPTMPHASQYELPLLEPWRMLYNANCARGGLRWNYHVRRVGDNLADALGYLQLRA